MKQFQVEVNYLRIKLGNVSYWKMFISSSVLSIKFNNILKLINYLMMWISNMFMTLLVGGCLTKYSQF